MRVLSEHLMDMLLALQTKKAVPAYAGINFSMAVTCRNTCAGECEGSCSGSCEDSCAGECEESCSGSCEYSCHSDCVSCDY